MGACHGKCCQNVDGSATNIPSSASVDHRPSSSSIQRAEDDTDWYMPSRKYQAKHIDNLILQTLKVIGKIGIEK